MINATSTLFGFIEPASSFRWQSLTGFAASIRLESRGGASYWYARKYANGRSYQQYICKKGELTEGVLSDAVERLEIAVGGEG